MAGKGQSGGSRKGGATGKTRGSGTRRVKGVENAEAEAPAPKGTRAAAKDGAAAKPAAAKRAKPKSPAAKGKLTRAAAKTPTRGKGAAPKRKPAAAEAASGARWMLWTAVLVLAVLAIRVVVVMLEPIPVHFDEAQYWAYGQELAWGYFSKPPGIAALIRATTEIFGDTLMGMRISTPVCHALTGWLIFATARRLFGAETGFFAALGFTLAPGVTVSAMIASTDPAMMTCWALALYAMVRAMEGGGLRWWALLGLAVGIGFLAKYTILAFAAGALGYGLFSARGRDLAGMGVALAAGLAVAAPNLIWNARNGFATVTHIAEDAAPGGSTLNPGSLAEFAGAQLGVIGPVVFIGMVLALWHRRAWREDWGMRLMAWQGWTLLAAMLVLAFITRAQPNWAAPAYIAGSILAARWLVLAGWRRLLGPVQAGIGCVAALALYGTAFAYHDRSEEMPRWADPYKKMRIGEPFCREALGFMNEMGAEVLLSTDRRRLSECMFLGSLGWDQVAVWNPDRLADNHHELVASLQPGDARPMLLAVIGDGAEIAALFDDAERIESGRFPTHADRDYPFDIWLVQGFRGHGPVDG